MKKYILMSFVILLTLCGNAFAVDVTWGTKVEVIAEDTSYIDMKPIDTDKLVICYAPGGSGVSEGECQVATVSGTTPTFGAINEFNSNVKGGDYSFKCMGVAAVDTDQFVVSYMSDAAGADGFMTAGNVSGTTISYGTEIEFETGDTEGIQGAAAIATDKMVVTYNDEDNSDTCQTIVCTNDGTPNLTCGSALECDGDGTTDYTPRDIDTVKIDTDNWVSCFNADDDTDDGYCVVGETSGTTITYTTDPTEYSVDAVYNNVCSPNEYGGTADRFMVVADVLGDVKAFPSTVSGTTITYGTGVTIQDAASATWPACAFVTETKVLISYEDNTNTDGSTKLCTVTWADRTMTCGSEEDFTTSQIGANSPNRPLGNLIVLSGFDGTAPKVAQAYTEDASGDHLQVIIGDLSFPAGGSTFIPKVSILQ